jgi:hypothetical protein
MSRYSENEANMNQAASLFSVPMWVFNTVTKLCLKHQISSYTKPSEDVLQTVALMPFILERLYNGKCSRDSFLFLIGYGPLLECYYEYQPYLRTVTQVFSLTLHIISQYCASIHTRGYLSVRPVTYLKYLI